MRRYNQYYKRVGVETFTIENCLSCSEEACAKEIYFCTYLMQGIVILEVSLWLGWAGIHSTCQICPPVPCWGKSFGFGFPEFVQGPKGCNLLLHQILVALYHRSQTAVHVAGAGLPQGSASLGCDIRQCARLIAQTLCTYHHLVSLGKPIITVWEEIPNR